MNPLESNDFPPRGGKHGVDHVIYKVVAEPFALFGDTFFAKTEPMGDAPAFIVSDGTSDLDPVKL